ncbi:MAG: histidinol dehydrogenase [Synergistaceae bacterium]|nr:histidinol dehydrogenase [Synergistota bacterium]NLM70462.1 histidinol dehydrogenase [Synergistaceae bacterium]
MIVLKEAESRAPKEDLVLEGLVAEILESIRIGGDEALLDCSERFDRVRPLSLRVTREEVESAYDSVPPDVVATIEFAADRIRDFAVRQRGSLGDLEYEISPGVTLGHRLIPVASCGCYVPAGRYPLPSSALMSVIPARVAGVGRIAACSPPRGESGIHPAVLVAMDIAGVDEIYCMGGAQAIAAFAYGTETVKKVDFITGPGNRYVTEAKMQVYGVVGIDMPAGPSEVAILADASANPDWVAADALACCEHDPDSWSVIVTTDRRLGEEVLKRVEKQHPSLPTGEQAYRAWKENGKVILAESLDEAVRIVDELAPEHVQVMTEGAKEAAAKLSNYGSLFVGGHAPVVFGDYASGPNHILPTVGSSRFANGVYVGTFLRTCSFQRVSAEGAKVLAGPCSVLAGLEGLFAHKRSSELRQGIES